MGRKGDEGVKGEEVNHNGVAGWEWAGGCGWGGVGSDGGLWEMMATCHVGQFFAWFVLFVCLFVCLFANHYYYNLASIDNCCEDGGANALRTNSRVTSRIECGVTLYLSKMGWYFLSNKFLTIFKSICGGVCNDSSVIWPCVAISCSNNDLIMIDFWTSPKV